MQVISIRPFRRLSLALGALSRRPFRRLFDSLRTFSARTSRSSNAGLRRRRGRLRTRLGRTCCVKGGGGGVSGST
jgi:hypothetical protein